MPQDLKLSSQDNAKTVHSIQPAKASLNVDWKELWQYRELFFFLAWRDLKVRYKQTVLGVTWVILQPILTMGVFSFIFGTIANLPSNGIPYPLLTFCGLLPWQLFGRALSSSSTSLVAQQNLITKIYFPRMIIPLASILSGMVDFCVSLVVMFVLMAIYGIFPSIRLITLPLFLLLALAASSMAGLWLSALNVKYRDVQQLIPFLTQFLMYITPVAYSSSVIPVSLLPIYSLNPMVCVIEGFRWALLGQSFQLTFSFYISLGILIILLVSGLLYFKNMEDTFADIV